MKNPFGIDEPANGELPEAENKNIKDVPSSDPLSEIKPTPEKKEKKHQYYSSFVKFGGSDQSASNKSDPLVISENENESDIEEMVSKRFEDKKKMDAHIPTLEELKLASASKIFSGAGKTSGQQGVEPSASGAGVSTPADTKKKPISVKEKKAIISGLSEKDSIQSENLNFFKRNFTLLIKLAILFLLSAVILAAGVFGFEQYEKYYRDIALEKILPAGANITVKITIDPESRQFKYLEENMEKFPGYEILKKKIDKVGEGKTASQIFQENLKNMNLDFKEDIKPLLGMSAYVIIPDLGPLGGKLQNRVLLSRNGASSIFERIKDSIIPSTEQVAEGEEVNNNQTVLGEKISRLAQKFNPIADEEEKTEKKLDFITASNIKDLKKAHEVLDKMKKDEKYEIKQLKYKGFNYFKVKAKEGDSQEKESEVFKFEETYHAILGKNWVVASREEDMKNTISRTKENLTVSGIFSKNSNSSLSYDNDWKTVIGNVNKAGEENLITAYYNINFKELFGKRECAGESDCEDISKYLKLSEKRIGGFLFRADDKGFAMRATLNDVGENVNAKSLKDGLAKKIPQKINDRWADLFWEHGGFKNAYYNFKKNNLTDKGLDGLNHVLTAIKTELGIDLETDFIDQIDGIISVSIFAGKGLEPQEAFVAEIKDGEKMVSSMKKIVELIKTKYAQYAQNFVGENASVLGVTGYRALSLTPEEKEQLEKIYKEYEELPARIMQSQITEAVTENGKIYSYKLPVPDDASLLAFTGGFSFDFSVENNLFILGSHYAAVESLLREIKNNGEGKLADNEYYKRGVQNSFPDKYVNTFFYMEGIWDAIDYYMSEAMKKAEVVSANAWQASLDARNKYCEGLTDKSKDRMCTEPLPALPSTDNNSNEDEKFAVKSIFQTFKVANFSKALKDGFARSFIFVNVEEIPKEEKERANKALDGLFSGLFSAREKAKYASFKSAVSSLVPQMIIACDERKIEEKDLTWEGNKYFDPSQAYKTLNQDCGPSGKGKFQVTINGIGEYSSYSGICNEMGCKFSP